MKSAIVAGVIAGIIAGIVGVLWVLFSISIGTMQADPSAPSYWFVIQILINVIWGGVFGFMYQMFHDSIPGKGMVKGAVFAFLLWLVHAIYPGSFMWAFYPALYAYATGMAVGGFIVRIVYGLVLGFLYKK